MFTRVFIENTRGNMEIPANSREIPSIHHLTHYNIIM